MLSLFNSNPILLDIPGVRCQALVAKETLSFFLGNPICLGNELLLIHGPRRMEFESEKEPIESEDEGEDLYPLEGKYKDEVDRRE